MAHTGDFETHPVGTGERLKLLEAAAAKHLEWIDKESAGPQYGKLTRDTHPLGEAIWCQWWQEQLDLCGETERLCRAGLAELRSIAA